VLDQRILTTPPYQDDPRPISVPMNAGEMVDFVKRLIDKLSESRRYWGSHHTDMQADRDLYKAKQTRRNKPYDGACELVVPMLVYTHHNLVARTKRAVFSPNPNFNLEGRSDEAKRLAQFTEDTIQREIGPEYVDVAAKLLPTLNGSFQDGTHIVMLRWRQDIRYRKRFAIVQRPMMDEYGMMLQGPMGPMLTQPALEGVPEPYPAYDNLDVAVFDKEQVDIWPPTAPTIQDAQGIGFRMIKSGNELLSEALQNNFDMAAVQYLRDSYQGDFYEPTTEHQRKEMTGKSDVVLDFATRPYKLTECYWLWSPSPSEPAKLYLITLHEDTKTVLRFRENPWWHGEIPAVEFAPLPGKYGILGRSLPNLVGDIQSMSTLIVRLLLDDLSWKVHPPHAAKIGTFTKPELELFKRRLAPGSVWEVTNPDGLKPLIRETGENPQIGLAFMELLRQFQARVSSVDDINMGKMASRQATATEIEEMLQEGEVMFAEMTDNLARSYLRLGRLIRMSMAQMAWHPTIQRVWAEAVAPDPTGMWALQALWADYDMEAAGSAAAANAALRKRQAMELYAMLMQNPLTANWLPRVHAVTSLVLNEYSQRYPERLIGTEQEAMGQQIQMMQQQAVMLAAQADQQSGQGEQHPASQKAS
jgi:hypothetical protein